MLVAAAFLAFAHAPVARVEPMPVQAVTANGRLIALPDDAVAYVPKSAGPNPPLLVLLHGAGRQRLTMIQHFEPEADARGLVLVAPTSRGPTWDAVAIGERTPSPDSPLAHTLAHKFSFSRDEKRVDDAIANLEKLVPVDRARTVLAGFSDGATFALAMGMSRYEPFAAVIAWSPGIAIEAEQPARGRPVYISHGHQDPLLKFEVTCGDIVPLLEEEGAKVTFLPFDGVHDAPKPVKDAFLDAVFGRVAGSVAAALPATPQCTSKGSGEIPVY